VIREHVNEVHFDLGKPIARDRFAARKGRLLPKRLMNGSLMTLECDQSRSKMSNDVINLIFQFFSYFTDI